MITTSRGPKPERQELPIQGKHLVCHVNQEVRWAEGGGAKTIAGDPTQGKVRGGFSGKKNENTKSRGKKGQELKIFRRGGSKRHGEIKQQHALMVKQSAVGGKLW